ncbi:MAG: RnfABCDGE type electron transport complex subunit C [Clostridia bacterium]|nr:RnfABCDGE type electron transport complex subunit C [Clostridia bacterium]
MGSFKRGIETEYVGAAKNAGIEKMPATGYVVLPFDRPNGQESLCVAAGSRVKKGELLVRGDLLHEPVFSSVSGSVVSVGEVMTLRGKAQAVTVENDFKEEWHPSVQPFSKPLLRAAPEEIREFLKNKGIENLDGEGLSLERKLSLAAGKAKEVIVNCLECEPYLHGVHSLLIHEAAAVAGGARILAAALGVKRISFVMDLKRRDEAVSLRNQLKGKNLSARFRFLSAKYPQQEERQMILAVKHREIPLSVAPERLGIASFGVHTVYAVYQAFVTGMPQVERVVTVEGDCVLQPSNLRVPLGAPLSELISRCGGFSTSPGRVLIGGPFSGKEEKNLQIPVTGEIKAILAFAEKETETAASCVRCGRCALVCPQRLTPTSLARLYRKNKIGGRDRRFLSDCRECGCCSAVCPVKIPLLKRIRAGKEAFSEKKYESEREKRNGNPT